MRLLPLLALAALVAWELLVRLFGVPAFLLPGPFAIAEAFWGSRGLLMEHAWPTAAEAIVGFLGAAVAGVL
ncbi:MAG TPA: ABC transporter permease, partial [Candidatus Thermoplasmatota archaeon]|nr:ABC transporter permease [Candidatus Thermoplasmatota archaeon]